MRIIFIFILITITFRVIAQNKNNKFELEISYGLNGNFFVRSYEEPNSPNVAYYFYNKNFIGTISCIELKYKIGKTSFLGLGYSRSINKRKINFAPNNIPVYIEDFTIRHFNDFYQLIFDKELDIKKSKINLNSGIYYLRCAQQEVDASINGLSFEERNYKNSRLEEAGLLIGIQYSKQIDLHFYIGLKSRFYFTVSTGTPEILTLTPTLTYRL